LAANPGLAKLGPILPASTVVFMPELTAAVDDSTVSLWD